MVTTKSGFWRQVRYLLTKDLTILITRHPTSTIYTALLLPVLMTVYLGVGQNLGGAGNKYGFAESHPIRSLEDGLRAADAIRSNVVFVDSGLVGGDVNRVISGVEERVSRAGKTSHRVTDTIEMGRICTVSSQGATPCYGAVVFNDSPNGGRGGVWNYTIRGDGVLGRTFKVDQDNNDPQIYILPLQRALDMEITRVDNPDNDLSFFDSAQEWPFTDQTESERKAEANRDYQRTFINYMGVAILLGFLGISYHLPGYIATEREKGLSQLIDGMMLTKTAWQAQTVRMFSYFCSFSATYFLGWVIGALVLKFMLWKDTSVGVVLPYFVLAGLAATAQALVGGTLFKRAQLSGVVNGLAFILLGVLAQAVSNLGTAGAVILGLLFTPCNMVLHIKYMARYQADGRPTDLLEPPSSSDNALPALVLWMFLLVQIIVCPGFAAWMERRIHGSAADSRSIWNGTDSTSRPQDAVVVQGLTKIYRPSLLRRMLSFVVKPRSSTVAVENLDISIPHGTIVSILGANGSGKSTTLDAIAGIQGFDKGRVTIDASGGIGIAPQMNVLWDELSVMEHVSLFNRLKSPFQHATSQDLQQLLRAVDLFGKKDAKSQTLSGGQKRKLQLAMMLTGGSAVCCIDEVSSGIDPLSRRKIWDILLAERGSRTIILTTHFLDEADLLSDKIAIMSKGRLRVEGSAVELKANLGSGYRIELSQPRRYPQPPKVEGVHIKMMSDSITYVASSSELAARVIRTLESAGITYRLSSPTMEDVFLQSAEEYATEAKGGLSRTGSVPLLEDTSNKRPLDLLSSGRVGAPKQIAVLMYKRLTLLKNNWLPYLIAFLIPIIAAAVMQLLVSGEGQTTCSPIRADQLADFDDFNELFENATIVAGPASSISNASVFLPNGQQLDLPVDTVNSFSMLETFVEDNRRTINPGGFWLGSPDSSPTVVYRADGDSMSASVIAQNLLNTAHSAIRIAASYAIFDTSLGAAGKTLQLALYFSIALSIGPAFLSLYPNIERRTHVRGLQYSSGVHVLGQWFSHLAFDFAVLLIPTLAAALIFMFTSDAFWNPGYLIPVFLLYGIAATLIGYIISLLMGSQLATWAAVVAFNGIGLAVYFITFLFVISLSDATTVDSDVQTAHYIIAIIFPIGSMIRAMLVSLNVFSQTCEGPDFLSYPGALNAYGAPILYLMLQSCLYFGILLLSDSRTQIKSIFSQKKMPTDLEKDTYSNSGIQIKNLGKKFGELEAVEDVSFDVGRGEVYCLLGPNGAGKSTCISMIRGDIRPTSGDVLVEQFSVMQNRALARANMGVCPQVDAIDNMTTEEHLRHYARLRGITDVSRQVDGVINAVGLEDYRHTMAPHLSGGNKRKLSLGMALTGNPSVILLDEPSSGLDAAAKRIMWQTLKNVVPGRSILLTTHSMEEADTLANRAGIMAKQMLAAGKVDDLQRVFGDSLYVHLVSSSAPHSTEEEMVVMRAWVLDMFPDAQVEEKTYHGQMRFSVPAAEVRKHSRGTTNGDSTSAIGQLLVLLEDNKEKLGIAYHSVAPTTLNEVFLTIVGRYQVQEEGYRETDQKKKKKVPWRKLLLGV